MSIGQEVCIKGEPLSKQNQSLKPQRIGCKQDILEWSVHYQKDSWVYTAITFGTGFPQSLFLPAHSFKTKDMKKSFRSSAVHIYQVISQSMNQVNVAYTACMEMVNQNKKSPQRDSWDSACV